jgi:hypothetical protein
MTDLIFNPWAVTIFIPVIASCLCYIAAKRILRGA